jgi:deoxyadenosine/deoxycytidine kinase
MKRLVIITVGKTHSGKTTFAKALEKELTNSLVIDQDNHAAFLNMFYKSLLPTGGPNTLKYALSQFIVNYAIEQTDFHLILCNSNRSKKGRASLLEELFNENDFIHIIVHFDIPDAILHERVSKSKRSTNIFRGAYTTFEEVLIKQQAEEVIDPVEGEADHLFVVKDSSEVDSIIREIVCLAKSQKPITI